MIRLESVGVRFRVPRTSRYGFQPRFFAGRRSIRWGIRNVDLTLSRGEVVGLIGKNGSGKTTLLRTIAGIYRADEGRVSLQGRVGPILSLGAGLRAQLNGWDNIRLSCALLGVSFARAAELLDPIAELSGLGDMLSDETRTYSAGMKARLGFAVAALSDPDILVVDEVITVADAAFREEAQRFIVEFAAAGGTVLIASHEVRALARRCDRLIRMESGSIVDVGVPENVARGYEESLVDRHAARDVERN